MQKKKFSLEFEKPILELEERIAELRQTSTAHKVDVAKEITALEEKLSATRAKIFNHLTPWQRVQLARHPQRPYSLDYFKLLFDDFQELHGDRLYMDDESTIGGIAFFEGEPLVLIGQQKGRDLKENLRRNFGCPNPEGYRKALRLMRLADTFQLPLVTFVDTPGAYPGTAGEERHVAEAIAANLREMSGLGVPVISIVIGEGGSGGALGIAVADRILILENAYYSVISPEGCAAILWKDKAHAPAAAEALKLDAASLQKLGVVDEIIAEPLGGAQENIEQTAGNIRAALHRHLKELKKLSPEKLRDSRYAKYREIGEFVE
ncbi:MAG: acetyl-CoA carboxylase carboxyltransferase subunit alpha [Puniceicoccales bacterium]|jgi:acetyl-CoA carboxylase carboxyl transferase subunit alpha|nr:acetyl-CoA carboxylase carboxyltransferase subunit alpha [Puniceicoccales bacterium]